MQRWILAAAAACALANLALADEGVKWAKSYDEALKGAKDAKKLVFIDFSAEG